jgi:hypothetical protein
VRKILISILTVLCLCLFLSCTRKSDVTAAAGTTVEQVLVLDTRHGAWPMAVLRAGEYPLWFQMTDGGPVQLETAEDAAFSSALVPWPLALHVMFIHEKDGEIIMAVNRSGFLKLAPYPGVQDGIAMYYFPGGLFKQYTIGGFVFYEEKPAVLLYLDDRFLDSDFPIPVSRTWTFNMESNTPFPVTIPALELFPADELWSVDTLRQGADSLFYYRAAKRNGQPVVHMLRTANLDEEGENISLDAFYGSAPRRQEISHPSLPQLPEGFVYTAIGRVGDSIAATWEEQEDFSIGSAGIMIVKENRKKLSAD